MKTFFLTTTFLITSLYNTFADADPEQIEKIRKIYNSTSTKTAAIEKSAEAAKTSNITVDHYIVNALNRSWEGVGNYKVTIKFFYTHDAPNDENNLLKITRSATSARTHRHEEFYYNPKGALVFYFQKTNDPDFPKEKRIYFRQGKAIRLIDDKFSRDGYTEGDKEIIAALLKREKALRLKFTSR